MIETQAYGILAAVNSQGNITHLETYEDRNEFSRYKETLENSDEKFHVLGYFFDEPQTSLALHHLLFIAGENHLPLRTNLKDTITRLLEESSKKRDLEEQTLCHLTY